LVARWVNGARGLNEVIDKMLASLKPPSTAAR